MIRSRKISNTEGAVREGRMTAVDSRSLIRLGSFAALLAKEVSPTTYAGVPSHSTGSISNSHNEFITHT